MGGEVVVLDHNDSQLGRGETLEDTVEFYQDMLM